jgi:hypothetical protein
MSSPVGTETLGGETNGGFSVVWFGVEVAQKVDDNKIDDKIGWTGIPPETKAFDGEMSAWDNQQSC